MELGKSMKMHKRILLGVAAMALFLVPVAALAGAISGFDDVPDDNIFAADIGWIKDAGITIGCNPPTNTEYCPSDNVTREQMAAFMHRLAANKVVDAATAVVAQTADHATTANTANSAKTADTAKTADHATTADSATTADTATMADDSDKVDGKDADELMSITGSDSVQGFNYASGSSATSASVVSITGFAVPAAGGVLSVDSNIVAEREPSGDPQLGMTWIVIDGSCSASITVAGGTGWYLTSDTIADSTSAIATEAVAAGSHRIDLCTAGVAPNVTTVMAGHLSVTWVPVASGAGVTASGSSKTYQELLAPYQGYFDN